MKKDTFKHIVEADGTEYFMQEVDEMDKDHGPDDTSRTNEGRINAANSKFTHRQHIFIQKLEFVMIKVKKVTT